MFGFAPDKVQGLALGCVELHCVHMVHFSILCKSLWLAPLCSSVPNVQLSLVLLINLLKMPSIPLSIQKESC